MLKDSFTSDMQAHYRGRPALLPGACRGGCCSPWGWQMGAHDRSQPRFPHIQCLEAQTTCTLTMQQHCSCSPSFVIALVKHHLQCMIHQTLGIQLAHSSCLTTFRFQCFRIMNTQMHTDLPPHSSSSCCLCRAAKQSTRAPLWRTMQLLRSSWTSTWMTRPDTPG